MSEADPNSSSRPPGGLGRRFLMGGFYLGASQWLSTGLNFAINLLLARLLGPHDFGLYAFVFSVNEFLNIVGAFSLSIALIQAREAGQELYDAAFAICAALGVLGLLAAGLIAPVLWWQHSPQAAWILIAMAVGRIPRLLAQVPQAKLERGLRYAPLSVIQVVSGNVPNFCALGLAWLGWGVWSLVARDVLVTVLLLAMSLAWSGYVFRNRVERASVRGLMRISTQLFTAVSVGILVERVDRVALGAFLGNLATGLYHQMRFLGETGALVWRPVSRVALNLYARLQDDPARLSRSHDLVNHLLVRLMLFGAVALFSYPAEVIRILLGDEWLGGAPLLRWFAFFAVAFPLTDNMRVLFYGLGRVRRNIAVALSQAVMVVPSVLLACWLDSLQGVALAVVGSSIGATCVSWWLSRDLVERNTVRTFALPFLLAALGAVLFEVLGARGTLAAVPWWLLPFLPSALFATLLFALEHRTLLAELAYLRSQWRAPA